MNSPLVKSKPVPDSRLSAVYGIDSPIPSANNWIMTSAEFPLALETTDGSQVRVGVVVLSSSHELRSHAALSGNGAMTEGLEVAVKSPQS